MYWRWQLPARFAIAHKWSGAVPVRRLRCPRDNPLVDLLPEPAAIRNVWENKLALVEVKGWSDRSTER